MDMLFRDDECRIRTDNAPANFATIKHMAGNLLRSCAGGLGSVQSHGVHVAALTNGGSSEA
jgi:hypothetical protein